MSEQIKRRSVLSMRVKSNDLSAAYDYVMVFPLEGEKGATKKQSNDAKNIIKAMETAGLELFSYLSVQNDEMIVLIRLPVSKC